MNNDRITFNEDKTLDEVVFNQTDFHLEQMSKRHFWIGVTDKATGKRYHINLSSRGTILARIEEQ